MIENEKTKYGGKLTPNENGAHLAQKIYRWIIYRS